jgi:hypothetical protein
MFTKLMRKIVAFSDRMKNGHCVGDGGGGPGHCR